MAVSLPLVIQQFISTFVSLLDNIMVGQVGTLAMSAVSVSNQLLMVVNLAIIGSVNAHLYLKKKEELKKLFLA